MSRLTGTLRVAIITGIVSLLIGLPASVLGQGGATGGGSATGGATAGGAVGGGAGGSMGGGGGGGSSSSGGGLAAGSASLGASTGLGGTNRGGSGGAGGGTAPSASNFLGSTYQYPYVQYPLPSSTTTTNVSNMMSGQGGSSSSSSPTGLQSSVKDTFAAYGSATFKTSGTTTTGRTGTARASNSRNLGTGNSTLTINGFSTMSTMTMGNVITPSYTLQTRFKVAARPAAELQSELKSLVISSESAPSAKNVAVDVVGRTVTLKGEVSSDDERRHIESLIRLTPGVSQIHNELTVKQ